MVRSIREIFSTVDSYIKEECLERSYRLVYYPVSVESAITGCNAVMLWLSGVVINRTFTSGGVDVSAHAYPSIIAA